MLDLTNPEVAKKRDAKLESAKASKSLTMGTSPFIDGVQFTISDFGYEAIDENDANSNFYAVFKTSLGPLSVQSLIKAKPIKPYEDKNTGETVFAKRPEGILSNLLRKILGENRGKTADEVLPLLVAACKDKKFVVRKVEYIVHESAYGDRATPIRHIDIVNE